MSRRALHVLPTEQAPDPLQHHSQHTSAGQVGLHADPTSNGLESALEVRHHHDGPHQSHDRLDSRKLPDHPSARSQLTAGLRIHTDTNLYHPITSVGVDYPSTSYVEPPRLSSSRSPSLSSLPVRTPSVKAILSTSVTPLGSRSPSSAISSPALAALADITPLPSPITLGGSPGPWKRMASQYDTEDPSTFSTNDSVLVTANGESISSALASQQKRKSYHGLGPAALAVKGPQPSSAFQNATAHDRNRDVSEYIPADVQARRPRHVTVSESGRPLSSDQIDASDSLLRREPCVAAQRGIGGLVVQPPTPPPSYTGAESDSDTTCTVGDERQVPSVSRAAHEVFEARCLRGQQSKRWTGVRELGVGSFSRVVLATSQDLATVPKMVAGNGQRIEQAEEIERRLDPKNLVAIKIVEHGPTGGESEERIDISLKRELDMLQSIRHPSLVHLKAFSIEPSRALLVLTYCPGGDMYDVASQKQSLLVPSLIRRIFAELVAATLYVHEQLIVHRDIKLENVLLNIRRDQLAKVRNWQTYPFALVTLTDMGLSRRIDPADPKLHTRCGSEDYAAPELLMGQAYDGRQTDAWALGVLLYAIMEGRLPFDPMPGAPEQQRMRSRTVHRIARCDWAWYRFVDEDGEPGDFGELQGARYVVEGLLKRASGRWTLDRVASQDWVRLAIQVDGGVSFQDESDEEL